MKDYRTFPKSKSFDCNVYNTIFFSGYQRCGGHRAYSGIKQRRGA